MTLGGIAFPWHGGNGCGFLCYIRQQPRLKGRPRAALVGNGVGIAAEALGKVAGGRSCAGLEQFRDGIINVVEVGARADNHVTVELPVFLEIDPTCPVVGVRTAQVVVCHWNRHVHDPLLDPCVPVGIHAIGTVAIRPGGLEGGSGGGGGRGVPGNKRAGLSHPGLGLLDARIHLTDERRDLVPAPLAEQRVGGGGFGCQAVAGFEPCNARGVVAFGTAFEPDIVVVNAINMAVRPIGPGGCLKVDQVHVCIDQVLEDFRVSRVKGAIARFRAGGGADSRGPVVIEINQVSGWGVAMLGIHQAKIRCLSWLESHGPAVNFDTLFAVCGVMCRLDERFQGVEVGWRKARHVGLAHAGWVGHIVPSSHLDHNHVAVGLADFPFLRCSGHAKQCVHLGLAEESAMEGIQPEGAVFGRCRPRQRCGKQKAKRKSTPCVSLNLIHIHMLWI